MALNFPGPYEVRINYNTLGIDHVARLNCNPAAAPVPGQTWDTITCVSKGGTNVRLDIATDFYVEAVRQFMSIADTDISTAELWKYTPDTFQSVFVSSYDLSVSGASAAAASPASQLILTLRSIEGGVIKANVMQSTSQPGAVILPAAFTTTVQDWANQFTGATSIWLARDTSYASTVLKLLPGQNEALFKRIYR